MWATRRGLGHLIGMIVSDVGHPLQTTRYAMIAYTELEEEWGEVNANGGSSMIEGSERDNTPLMPSTGMCCGTRISERASQGNHSNERLAFVDTWRVLAVALVIMSHVRAIAFGIAPNQQ